MEKKRNGVLMLLLAAIPLLFAACQDRGNTGGGAATAEPAPPVYAKGEVADWADYDRIDPENGVIYFGAIKVDYQNHTSERSYCYRFDGIRSAEEEAKKEFNGESILLDFQRGPDTDPTLEPHPVDSEDHFNYLRSVIDTLDETGTDNGSVCAYTLSLSKHGTIEAVYTFRTDRTVEIRRGDEVTHSSVDEETFVHIAMLCTIYTPYSTYGNALLLRGLDRKEILSAEEYKLEIKSGDKTKEYDAAAAVALANKYLGDGSRAMTFAPVINVRYDFENGEYILFRETYKLAGENCEKVFYLGSDGRVCSITGNTVSSRKVYLPEDPFYLEFVGSALRFNRSKDVYDYTSLKAMIEG